MIAKNPVLMAISSMILLAIGEMSLALSGNPPIRLAWNSKTEVLEYRSCGAADACWMAQEKNKMARKQIASLRCDGEKLFSTLRKRLEIMAAEDCRLFENESKFQEIPKALRTLMNR